MLDRLHTLTITDQDVPAVMVGFLATLYFEDSHSDPVRDRVAAVVETYEALCAEHVRWIQHPTTACWHPYGSARVPTLRALFQRIDQNHAWELSMHGGVAPEAAGDIGIAGFGQPAWESSRLGYLQLALPGAWLLDRKRAILDTVLAACGQLRPVHGYGGLGILESHDAERVQQFQPRVYGLARQRPGLEVDVPLFHLAHLTAGIKGVNWLTILDHRWLERVPALAGLRAASEEYRVHDYGSGQMIQAGDLPALGDAAVRDSPALYARLARMLRPIRITSHTSFHFAGPDRFDDHSSMQWLARFDGAGT